MPQLSLPALGVILFSLMPLLQLANGEQQQERYLLAIGINGPNNAVIALKEAIVFAKLHNRTVVLPPMMSHSYDDPNRQQEVIPIESIFDVDALRQFVPIKLFDEVIGTFWNGSLDFIVESVDENEHKFLTRYLQQLAEHYPKFNYINGTFRRVGTINHCDTTGIEHVESLITESTLPTIPAVSLYRRIVWEARKAMYEFVDDTPCTTLYNQVCSYFVKSPLVQRLAEQWIAEHLGPTTHYVMMHVRPFSDYCMDAWRPKVRSNMTMAFLSQMCDMPALFLSMGPVATQILLRMPTWHHLVVMASPAIRPTVALGLAAYNIVPHFVDIDFTNVGFAPGAGVETTVLGMIEQEVALRSSVFVGTDASSMSVNIMHERTARGVPLGRTTTFERVVVASGLEALLNDTSNQLVTKLVVDALPNPDALDGIDAPWDGSLRDPFKIDPDAPNWPWQQGKEGASNAKSTSLKNVSSRQRAAHRRALAA